MPPDFSHDDDDGCDLGEKVIIFTHIKFTTIHLQGWVVARVEKCGAIKKNDGNENNVVLTKFLIFNKFSKMNFSLYSTVIIYIFPHISII